MTEFSDYIVYADESGSPVLDGSDPNYPIFVLVFLLVKKEEYSDRIVPAIQRLKFDFVGHDQLILHERDIRRQSKDFAFLQVGSQRRDFIERINDLVAQSTFEVIVSIIFKDSLRKKYAEPYSPYELALQFCMEKARSRLIDLDQKGKHVHVVFEGRGKKEDQHLAHEFRKIANDEAKLPNRKPWGSNTSGFEHVIWRPIFADKKSNSAGLQLADLIARPVGLKMLRPEQANRAYDLISPKIPFPGPKQFP